MQTFWAWDFFRKKKPLIFQTSNIWTVVCMYFVKNSVINSVFYIYLLKYDHYDANWAYNNVSSLQILPFKVGGITDLKVPINSSPKVWGKSKFHGEVVCHLKDLDGFVSDKSPDLPVSLLCLEIFLAFKFFSCLDFHRKLMWRRLQQIASWFRSRETYYALWESVVSTQREQRILH